MGNPRIRSKLLPQKVTLIREHSELTQRAIKERLQLSSPSRVSEYENGKQEPPAEVLLGYARLARVPLESIVDDEITLREFQSQLARSDVEKTGEKTAQAGRKKRASKAG